MDIRNTMQWLTGIIVAGVLLAPGGVLGAEVTYPVAAYNADELKVVREWEKTWAGKKIDKTNVDQVAEFLPPSYVGIYKEPEKWGSQEPLYAIIEPYKEIVETAGVIAATKKYAPQVQTTDTGYIANYADIAGYPYPAPKTGLEVAWNFDFNNHGDTSHYHRISPNINPKTQSDRMGDQEQWEYYFIHRTELEPMPAVPDNPRGYHRGIFLHMWGPPEFINTRYYSLRYIDPTKDDEMYMWYAQFRRIRRMSTEHRCDSVDGTDLIYDDEFFWDGHIQRNTYTLKGTKELLCSRHQDMEDVVRKPGQVLPTNVHLERCKTYIVEAVNKDPNYVYGKRVWYVDPENYLIRWSEIYDQQGRFWKCYLLYSQDIETKTGATKNFIVGYTLADFQRTHGGYNKQKVKGISLELSPKMFTVGYLQKTY